MKEQFRDKIGLSKANLVRLQQINQIIQKYAGQGYKLTLRQLYYQLVSRDMIPNKVQEYAKLGNLLVKGRMGGLVDWDAIEDRIRVPFLPYWVLDIEDAVNDTIKHYRLNRQEGQENYIELWVEKDALSGVLKRVTSRYHINLMVNRGYSSCTAVHDAYKRFRNQIDLGKKCYVLYLGDHDPSGLDMVRDIQDRIFEFLRAKMPHKSDRDLGELYFEIRQIALTQEQIKEFDPPPNPAKITDPRADWYIANYGETSWEVDALDPETLHDIVETNVEELMDMDKYQEQLDKEERDKQRLRKFSAEEDWSEDQEGDEDDI